MIRTIVLSSALLCTVGTAAAKPWKPHPIKVIPGVPLKPEDIKPYTPPKLAAEPAPEPTDVKAIQIVTLDATVSARPWGSPLVGTLAEGARIPVKGVIKNKGGCKLWYAIEPFGWVCSRDAKPTDEPLTTEQVLKVREGSRVPFQYVMVLVKEGDFIPMWATLDEMKKGAEPERKLEKGDTIAVDKIYKWDGAQYWISVEGKVLPQKGTSQMGPGAEWHGVVIDEKLPLPFGWITPEKANVYAAPPQGKAKPDAQMPKRTRVLITGEQMVGRKKYLKVTVSAPPPPPTYGNIFIDKAKLAPAEPVPPEPLPELPEMWVSAEAINEVRVLERPKTVGEGITKWVDVDLGEQVLVLYDADKPVWATLVSSGRAIPTPMGTYPVWAKVYAITMKSQPYDDKPYFVNKVPWSTFFQWHNAIHGAYWHDRFGMTKSHGCVNVAPLDAKYVFEWVTPPIPPGWTGYRPTDLLQSPTVVVRNSHMKKQFRQDRPIGPPDKELEAQRAIEADEKRAQDAAAAAAAQPPAPPEQAPPAP